MATLIGVRTWPHVVGVWLGFLGIVAVIAVVGSLASVTASESYTALTLPSWAPPSWVFGPVWTVLYVLIATAGWQLWRSAGQWRTVQTELSLYAVGLVLNAVWTPLFFGAGAPVAALVDIVLLVVVVAATIVVFARRDGVAALLLVPYWAWTAFATALNAAIVVLN